MKQKKIAIGNVMTSKTIEPTVARISIKPDPSGSAKNVMKKQKET